MKDKRKIIQKIEKINRVLHRDLGYLFIGMTIIYGLSGIAVILRHAGINISYTEKSEERQFQPNLTKKEFTSFWQQQKDLPKVPKIRSFEGDTCSFRMEDGRGIYIKKTGKLELVHYDRNKLIKFVNDVHYNRGRRFTWLALLYSFILVFFAISGAIIAKGKKGFMRRGIWFTSLGIAIPVIIYFFM